MGGPDIGLVNQHLHNVRVLANKALDGIDVRKDLVSVVDGACKQFLLAGPDPMANLAHFTGQLRLQADTTHDSQPAYKATLLRAVELCPPEIK